jgi:hypothetical protein
LLKGLGSKAEGAGVFRENPHGLAGEIDGEKIGDCSEYECIDGTDEDEVVVLKVG